MDCMAPPFSVHLEACILLTHQSEADSQMVHFLPACYTSTANHSVKTIQSCERLLHIDPSLSLPEWTKKVELVDRKGFLFLYNHMPL